MARIFSTAEFACGRPQVSLDGTWAFSYDPDDVGECEAWYADGAALPEEIVTPGCSQARAYPSARGNVRVTDVFIPEHSSTIMLKHGCLHPSWYRRTFAVPADWRGQRIHLHLGGVKPAAEFWLNGEKLGGTLTSRAPVRVDLTPHLRPGAEQTLAMRLSWPRLRLDGVYDVWHAWSGLYRAAWVEAVPAAHLADLHVRTAIDPPAATVRVTVRGAAGRRLRAVCEISGHGQAYGGEATVRARGEEAVVTVAVPMPEATLWSPRAPHLYRAVVRLYDGEMLLDEGAVRVGVREVAVRGRRVLLNGTPIFLRGGCDDQVYPHTVCPPADVDFFRARLRKAKAYGFNYTKSACDIFIPEFLDAADELGYLVCQEMPFGALGELRMLRDDPPAELADLWRRELPPMVRNSRNHPSVVAYSMTSEQAVDVENPAPYRLFCRELPALTRRLDPDALIFDVTSASCMGAQTRHGRRDTDLLEESMGTRDFTLTPLHGPLDIPSVVRKPFVLHEWNWISALPDPASIARYAALPLEPVQVPEMVEAARASGVLDALPEMIDRSRRLKYRLRKDAYELAREHPKVAGYHGWLIHDVVYCPEGVFDEFWNEPADLPAEEFRTYNDDTVLTLDDRDRRSFFYGERVPLGVGISHFGPVPLAQPVVRWQLAHAGQVVASGEKQASRLECGRLGRLPLPGIGRVAGQAPAMMELTCELWDGACKVCWNHWPLWFFPRLAGAALPVGVYATQPLPFRGAYRLIDPLAPPADARVFITHRLLDGGHGIIEMLVRFLENGGRALLLSHGALPEAESCLYRTVPYNTGNTGNMGTVIAPHPALGDFPHEGWCDLPFIPLIEGSYPIRLDTFLPRRIAPIIRSSGHQVTMVDKAYLFEVGLGAGTLLVCSLGLQPQCHVDPAAQYLLHSLVRYLAEGAPAPRARITAEELKAAAERM